MSIRVENIESFNKRDWTSLKEVTGIETVNVSTRFEQLLNNLSLTQAQFDDAHTKHTGVRTCLNSHYYPTSSSCYDNSLLVGSWGKSTQIRPPRDIDVLFILPDEVLKRFNKVHGNKQSQLLQEVRSVLLAKYPDTEIKANSPVVLVPFSSYNIEVVPVFPLPNGKFNIFNTKIGRRFVVTDPQAEVGKLNFINHLTNGNTKNLIRIIKCWQHYCDVPLSSFCIELISQKFLLLYKHKNKTTDHYHIIVLNFFRYLHSVANKTFPIPGISKTISLGNVWRSKAKTAVQNARAAVKWELRDCSCSAGQEWQKIFGTNIPKG